MVVAIRNLDGMALNVERGVFISMANELGCGYSRHFRIIVLSFVS